ncbi:unnamed protein product [Linum tenue]|uniref:EF-hand domain-containing protein n=1 Tax=Linum tenue TaxID=586396 RepID=A0AAV0NNM2_9ROSI|nr:unnamed protein product [Linum tenue]
MVAVVETAAANPVGGGCGNEANMLNVAIPRPPPGNDAACTTATTAQQATTSPPPPPPSSMADELCHISCTTFNILAPIYKRLDQQNQSLRESDFRAFWLSRNQMILEWLLMERTSIICLQEFWTGNEELVHMYEDKLCDAGYFTFQLARTNNRGDGKHCFFLITSSNSHSLFQILHANLLLGIVQGSLGSNLATKFHRWKKVYKILQYVETYQRENKLGGVPVILSGDWNGSKRGRVYKFLRSQGFASSYDIAHKYTDSDDDAHRWVSHRNHRGNICGVDFIWLRNPNEPSKPLKTSWAEAAFGIIKCQLQKVSLKESDAFAFLKADNPGDFITYSTFCDALRQVHLIGLPYGLSFQETKDLWSQADIDGNGIIDYEEFKKTIWNSSCCSVQRDDNCAESAEFGRDMAEEVIGFTVKDAVLFPREVERGMWPENYSLSDHARLTVIFSPVRMRFRMEERVGL